MPQCCRAALRDQLFEKRRLHRLELVSAEVSRREERIVQFIGVARLRPRLGPHAIDRRGIELSKVASGCTLAREP